MGIMFDAISKGAVQKAASLAAVDGDTKTLVDLMATLKEEKEEQAKVYDTEINKIETELMSRGLRQLEDKNVKYTTFRGDKASITIGLARALKILNVDNLKKAVTERWEGEIKTKEPDHTVAADFSRALMSLHLDDYISEMSLPDLLAKGVTINNDATGGEEIFFTKDDTNLLLKKLKGDYEKDKKLLEGILGCNIWDELDEELYFIAKIKNWERIRKYFTQDEAMNVKMALKSGMFVQETVRMTMRQ